YTVSHQIPTTMGSHPDVLGHRCRLPPCPRTAVRRRQKRIQLFIIASHIHAAHRVLMLHPVHGGCTAIHIRGLHVVYDRSIGLVAIGWSLITSFIHLRVSRTDQNGSQQQQTDTAYHFHATDSCL